MAKHKLINAQPSTKITMLVCLLIVVGGLVYTSTKNSSQIVTGSASGTAKVDTNLSASSISQGNPDTPNTVDSPVIEQVYLKSEEDKLNAAKKGSESYIQHLSLANKANIDNDRKEDDDDINTATIDDELSIQAQIRDAARQQALKQKQLAEAARRKAEQERREKALAEQKRRDEEEANAIANQSSTSSANKGRYSNRNSNGGGRSSSRDRESSGSDFNRSDFINNELNNLSQDAQLLAMTTHYGRLEQSNNSDSRLSSMQIDHDKTNNGSTGLANISLNGSSPNSSSQTPQTRTNSNSSTGGNSNDASTLESRLRSGSTVRNVVKAATSGQMQKLEVAREVAAAALGTTATATALNNASADTVDSTGATTTATSANTGTGTLAVAQNANTTTAAQTAQSQQTQDANTSQTVSAYEQLNNPSALYKSSSSTFINAGTILYATLNIGVNTDEISPITATVIEPGPLQYKQFVGTPQLSGEKALITFSTVGLDGQDLSVNAVAVDLSNWRTGVADSVDTHAFARYGKLLLAAFLDGYADSLTSSTTTTSTTGSTTTVTDSLPSAKDQVLYAVGTAGATLVPIYEKAFDQDPTVTVNANREIGIMFLTGVSIPQ